MSHDLHRFVRDLFSQASAELLVLFDSAIDNAALLHADFLSLRDLVDIAGYQEQESLHALLLLLFLALAEGSLCIEGSAAGLGLRLADLVEEKEAKTWVKRILADLGQHGFPNLIGHTPQEDKPVLWFNKKDRKYLYFHKFLRSELALGQELTKQVQEPMSAPHDWQEVLHEVLHEMPLQVAGQKVQLDRDQLLALGLALVQNFLVVSGGPGTGKTSLVLTLLRCLVRGGVRPEQIALAAPTGRAAQRLADSLRLGLQRIAPAPSAVDQLLHQLRACTLHQLLEYHPTRGLYRRHAENPLQAEIVIVDEVSMVGVVLMAQLLQALRPGTKLILLGDKDQLPSVEAGAVLASLMPAGTPNCFAASTWKILQKLFPESSLEKVSEPGWPNHLLMLQVNHRSQAHIREVAGAINLQALDIIQQLPVWTWPTENKEGEGYEPREGCWLLETSTTQPAEIRRILQHWARQHHLADFPKLIQDCELTPGKEEAPEVRSRLEELFKLLEGNRILTILREGPWGAVGINRFLDQFLRPYLDRTSRGNLFAGAPVLITTNDHGRELYNGDVGLTVKSQGSLRVVFQRRGGFVSFPAESLPAHELGFALTVHKSQGSEYDRVLLILPPSGGRRLLSKEILYTGMTRARTLAILCGSREVLQLAISRKILRESGLTF